MQDEVGGRKCSLSVVENSATVSDNNVLDEFEMYKSRAYGFAGGCLLDVKHTSLGGTGGHTLYKNLPATARLMTINDSCSDDSGVSDVTGSPSPKSGGDMVSRHGRRSTMPSPLRKNRRKRYARKASCPEAAPVKVDKPKFFVFEKSISVPCGKATRVETCDIQTSTTQKHRVRLVSEGSIEKSDIQQFKTVNFLVKSGEEGSIVPEEQANATPRVGRSARRSLPSDFLHTGHDKRRSRTPSPSNVRSKTSLLQSKARRPSELPMDTHSSSFRPRTRSMPSRNRAYKLQQNRSMTIAEGCTHLNSDYRHQGSLSTGDDLETEAIYRVRSFSTSGKTVINRGDSFKSCTTSSGHASSIGGSLCSVAGEDSCAAQSRTSSVSSQGDHSDCSSCGMPPPMYKVLMLGAHGVGKSSLAQQFTTSEYMGHLETFPGKFTTKSLL